MRHRGLFASILMACMLAVGFFDLVPAANAASAGPAVLNRGKHFSSGVVEIKHRGRRGPRFYLPIAPSYRYYDYPYYYSRGHYPFHIRPGFIYYGYPYSYYTRRVHRGYDGACAYWHRRCLAKRYRPHKSAGACRCP